MLPSGDDTFLIVQISCSGQDCSQLRSRMPSYYAVPPKLVRSDNLSGQLRAWWCELRLLTVGLPCVGLDGASRALNDLGVRYLIEWAFDIESNLIPALHMLHGNRGLCNFRIGKS